MANNIEMGLDDYHILMNLVSSSAYFDVVCHVLSVVCELFVLRRMCFHGAELQNVITQFHVNSKLVS